MAAYATFYNIIDMADFKRAQKEAEAIWQKLCLTSPPIPILEVTENHGLLVRDANFSAHPKISGILDVKGQIIYINAEESPARKRFTIAHELGHWILHPCIKEENSVHTIYYRRPIDKETDDLEKEANCFAANLLVPIGFLKKYRDLYPEQELAALFAVSQEVIGYRLRLLEGKL
jgi:Zn-dependent peptidase ImmA (M78 family)